MPKIVYTPGSGWEEKEDDPESTTITFRIKKKDKDEIQQLADDFTGKNITKLIKKAVKLFKDQNLAGILQKRGFWEKDVLELVKNQAQSDDPVVIQAKLESFKPRLMMQQISEFEERMRSLQQELRDQLNAITDWKFKFE